MQRQVSDGLWEIVSLLLLTEYSKRKGGRPRASDRSALEGIVYVLKTGPSPVDRGKRGFKRHVVTDANGVPLAVMLTGAYVHDSTVFEELVDSVPPVKGTGGRPRKRPEKLHADKGYDYPRCRSALHRRGIKARIVRRGIESSERLGRWRWLVERTFSWISCCRRLTIRYERRADIRELSYSCHVR